MGTRGPPPTPTSILALRGSWLAKTRAGEPRPPIEEPSCPNWLSKEAKAEWRRQVKALIALNLVSKIDRAALALFCEAWAEFVVTVETLSRSSLLIKNNLTGGLERNPLLFVRDRAAERILRLSDRFGFSPAARARLRVVEGEQHAQNSKEKFFKSSAKSG